MAGKYRILIADDHPLYRTGLVQMLGQRADDSFEVAFLEAGSVSQIHDLLKKETDIDLLIMDLHMPGTNGFTGLANLLGTYPMIPVAVISGDQRAEAVQLALSFGVVGFLPKRLAPEELAEIVFSLLQGKTWFPDADKDTNILHIEKISQFAQRLVNLTPHQFRIYQMVGVGLLNKQIAYELDISLTTVKSHLTAILRKLQVRDRKQLIIMAKSLELYDMDSFDGPA